MREPIDNRAHPIAQVPRRSAGLGPDELAVIRSWFRPAPQIKLLESQGFRTAVVPSDDSFATFVGHRPA